MKEARTVSSTRRELHIVREEERRERLAPFKGISGRVSRTPLRSGIPDVPPEQRALDELVMQVRKLRWMGFKDEADRVQRVLHNRAAANSRLTESKDTD